METLLLKKYKEEVVPLLQDKLGMKNINQVPKIEKIVINSCVGREINERKQAVEDAKEEIKQITGQSPVTTKAKKSVSNFKLREGEAIGAKVTLRGKQMYDFLLRLTAMAIPRIRDFRGIPPKSFDGRGNYTLGIDDQSIFPEIELDKIKRNIGFDITIVTTSNDDAHAYELLAAMGMPFRKPQKAEAPAA